MPDPAVGLLAVDVDGTLVHGGRLSDRDAAALRRAARAGVMVCLCTGRSWQEVAPVWRDLALPAPHGPAICVGGAVVVEPQTGRSLYSRAFDRALAARVVGQMRDLGYPVMVLVDAWREGFDYYLVGPWEDQPLYRRFFVGRGHRIRGVAAYEPALAAPIRLSVLEEPAAAPDVSRRLAEAFAGQLEVQDIHAPNYGVHIVEAFSARTTKFSALMYVAQGYRLGPASLAAIGDDHNDIPMLRGAAFSAAPADSPPRVREAAKTLVAPRGQDAVAEFVDALLGPPEAD